MSRIADALEHESQAVDLEQGDFERLLGRRERKQRNRRIRAGALGVIVALAMGLVFARSVRTDGIPADRPEPRPAPSVVSGALVYASEGNLYVADPDGTNAVRITDVGALDDECPGELGYQAPSWSPDGRYLAFRGPQDPGCSNPTGVVITDPQGNVVAAFPGQEQWNIMAPEWSPDSTRVAVWDEYWRTIGVYRIDGTRETQVAMPPGSRQGDIGFMAWMPDGASLIVDQYEVPLDGATPREIFPFTAPFQYQAHHYSTDGSLVAYTTSHGLMVARADGSEPRAVFGHVLRTWTWSLNGELIALTAPADPGDPRAPDELHVVDVATGSVTQVFEGERRTDLWVIGFSPDGDRILFTGSGLWSVGVDGSDAHQVANAGEGAWRPI
jgi:Tol biopolymer transport system component